MAKTDDNWNNKYLHGDLTLCFIIMSLVFYGKNSEVWMDFWNKSMTYFFFFNTQNTESNRGIIFLKSFAILKFFMDKYNFPIIIIYDWSIETISRSELESMDLLRHIKNPFRVFYYFFLFQTIWRINI